MAARILVTGPPGVGKTTVVRRVVEQLGLVAGGFWTEEIRERGLRVGFRVTDLRTGREGVLAQVDYKGAPRVGKYGVDVECFDRIGVAALREAMEREGCIVVDEIGKMELCSKAFPEAVVRALDSDHPVLGTLPVHEHPFVIALRQRQDIRVVRVAVGNRDRLPHSIAALLSAGPGSMDSRDAHGPQWL
jgi:nucleoside-triphosphatase